MSYKSAVLAWRKETIVVFGSLIFAKIIHCFLTGSYNVGSCKCIKPLELMLFSLEKMILRCQESLWRRVTVCD